MDEEEWQIHNIDGVCLKFQNQNMYNLFQWFCGTILIRWLTHHRYLEIQLSLTFLLGESSVQAGLSEFQQSWLICLHSLGIFGICRLAGPRCFTQISGGFLARSSRDNCATCLSSFKMLTQVFNMPGQLMLIKAMASFKRSKRI